MSSAPVLCQKSFKGMNEMQLYIMLLIKCFVSTKGWLANINNYADKDKLEEQITATYVKYLFWGFESMPTCSLSQAKADQ